MGFLNNPKNTKANLKKIWSTWGTNLRTNCPNHTFRMVWFEGLLVTNTKTNPTPDIDSRPYINSHILKQYCATPTYLAFCHTDEIGSSSTIVKGTERACSFVLRNQRARSFWTHISLSILVFACHKCLLILFLTCSWL